MYYRQKNELGMCGRKKEKNRLYDIHSVRLFVPLYVCMYVSDGVFVLYVCIHVKRNEKDTYLYFFALFIYYRYYMYVCMYVCMYVRFMRTKRKKIVEYKRKKERKK